MKDDLRGLYDAIEPGYYDRVYRRGRGVQWFWHHHRMALVRRYLPRPLGRVLDLGCGPGTFLGHLDVGYEQAVGIDLAQPQVDYAAATYGGPHLSFRQGDVASLAPGEEFDAVVAIEVIEHLPPADASGFLAAVHSVLRPGGTLVLTTPNDRSHWPLLERLVSRLGPVDYRVQHVNLYDRRRLAAEVAAHGFHHVQVETFFVLAPFLAPLSASLAAAALAAERRLLPQAGAELLLTAERA